MKSLRSQLTVFWFCLAAVSATFLLLMATSVSNSVEAQAAGLRSATRSACQDISDRYKAVLPDSVGAEPRLDLLQAMLQLALLEKPQVEGGIWHSARGMQMYAFPTYRGGDARALVAPSEQPVVLKAAAEAVRSQDMATEVEHTGKQAFVVSACPLQPTRHGLVAWTLSHTRPDEPVVRENTLRFAMGVALAAMVASGAWLGLLLVRSRSQMERLQARLAEAERQLADGRGGSTNRVSP
jgi:hypothetical protein